MSINLGEIIIKDFTTSTLTKLQKNVLSTEGAVRKMMHGIKEGGKNAVPSIDALSYRLEKLRERRDSSFSRSNIRLFNQEIKKTERQLENLKNLPPLSIRERFIAIRKSITSSLLPISGLAFGVMGIRSSLGSAISTGIEFNKEMSKVKALSNANDSELRKLTATARQMGAATAFSAAEAAQGMSYLAMAGFSTNQIIEAIPSTLSLAAAGSIGLGEAADIASNVLTQFGLEAQETSRVADVMAKTITTSNTNMQEMGEAMKYLGPTATAMGVGLEESSAIVGLLANSGIKGSLASRALGTALTRLAKPTNDMQQSMNELGIQFFNNEGKFVGIAGVVNQLEGAFVGLNDKQRAAYVSTLFGAESFQEMSILLQNGSEKIKQYTDDLVLSKGVADRIAETKLDNLAGDWVRFKSVVSEFAIQSYEKIKPFFRSVVQGFTSFVTVVNNSGKYIRALTLGIVTYIGIAKSSIILTRALSALKLIWNGVTKLLTVSQWRLNVAMSSNPLGAVAVVVGLLVTGYSLLAKETDNLTASQRALKNLKDEISEATQNERAEASYLIDIMKDANASTETKYKAYEKLKRLYPEIIAGYKDEKDALNNLDAIQQKITDNIEERAKKEVAAKLYKQSFEDEIRKKQEIEAEKKDLSFFRIDDMPRLKKEMDAIYKARELYKGMMGNNQISDINIESDPTNILNKETKTSTIEQTTENIVTGGKRQTVLTINIDKVIDNIEQHVSDGVDAADDIVDKVLDGLTRRIHGTARGLMNI